MSTILSTSVNLINNLVGAGLFSMPWCLSQATLFTGCAAFVMVANLNLLSFQLLANSCELSGTFSYLQMGQRAFGHHFGVAVQLSTMLYAGGSLVSYIVLAGDFLVGDGTGVLALWAAGTPIGTSGLEARAIVCSVLSLFVLFPLCLLRSIDSLRYTSYIALACTIFAGSICVYEVAAMPKGSVTSNEAAAGAASLRRTVNWIGFPITLWEAIPITNVAFIAHYNAPRYYVELKDRSPSRYLIATGSAITVSLAVYLVVGVSGYVAFGSWTLGDVLENFAPSYTLAVAVRLALVVVLISVFPKAHHSIREGAIQLLSNATASTDTLPFWKLTTWTFFLVAAATMLGVLCQQVEVVLAYKGAIFGSLMVYIYPSLMHTSLSMQALQESSGSDKLLEQDRALHPAGAASFPIVRDGTTITLSTSESHPSESSPALISASPRVSVRKSMTNSLPQVLWALFCNRQHFRSALLLLWGIVTSVLGVAITIRKQLRQT